MVGDKIDYFVFVGLKIVVVFYFFEVFNYNGEKYVDKNKYNFNVVEKEYEWFENFVCLFKIDIIKFVKYNVYESFSSCDKCVEFIKFVWEY